VSYEQVKDKFSNQYPAIDTGDEDLLERNKTAFQKIRFLPKFCKGAFEANLETTLFGKKYAAPIGVAPVGLTGLMWPRVEHYLAASCKRFNIPYALSTLATETPETVGKYVGDMGWFQLYPPIDMELTKSLLQRAKESGFHTLVVTADVPMASRRERTKRAGLAMPPKITPKMIWEGITHPAWSYHTIKNGLPRLKTVESYTDNTDFKFVSGFVGNRLGGTLDWDYCQQLKEMWGDEPVLLKGVLHPQNAATIEIGLDGIYVSNHGARQFNGAITAIEALPAIVKEVNGKVPIIFDSGVTTGLDIMRAVYLGADFVMAGRAFIAAVAALGKYGGDHAAHIFMDDLQNNMVQLGVANLEELKEADLA